MKTSVCLISLCLIVLLVGAGQCATESHSYDIPLDRMSWTQDIVLPQFNAALGTLNSINLILNGFIVGSIKFENTSTSSPNTPTLTINSLLTLKHPGGSTLLQANPIITHTETVSIYDGTLDYGGASGRTYNSLNASDEVSLTILPTSSDFSMFMGTGGLLFPVSSSGTSRVSGGGNLAAMFLCDAGASGTVVYNYDPVPEPSSMIAMLVGLTGLVGFAVRRRK